MIISNNIQSTSQNILHHRNQIINKKDKCRSKILPPSSPSTRCDSISSVTPYSPNSQTSSQCSSTFYTISTGLFVSVFAGAPFPAQMPSRVYPPSTIASPFFLFFTYTPSSAEFHCLLFSSFLSHSFPFFQVYNAQGLKKLLVSWLSSS